MASAFKRQERWYLPFKDFADPQNAMISSAQWARCVSQVALLSAPGHEVDARSLPARNGARNAAAAAPSCSPGRGASRPARRPWRFRNIAKGPTTVGRRARSAENGPNSGLSSPWSNHNDQGMSQAEFAYPSSSYFLHWPREAFWALIIRINLAKQRLNYGKCF